MALTDLLKKDAFICGSRAQKAFDKLKDVLITAPTLALPNFTKQFVVETDASFARIGVVLT